MTELEAIHVVLDGLVGPDSLPVRLRRGEGLDEAQLARIEVAATRLGELWAGRDVVPRRVAAAFVDIGTTLAWAGAGASKAEQERIEVAALRLVELAHELFGDPV